jgi:RNase P subunit RPR2
MSIGFWYGVLVRFKCSTCEKVSTENVTLSTESNDKSAIRRVLNSQKLFCQLCKAPLENGVEVDARIEPGTPQRLRALGFDPA